MIVTAPLKRCCVLERRANEPPDETSKPSLERRVERRCARRQRVPRRVQIGQTRRVVGCRFRRNRRHGLQRAVEGGQRGVVEAVGLEALAFEAREEVFDGLPIVGHAI